MPNSLMRTLTIDGASQDVLGVGNYLALDDNNNVKWNFQSINGNAGSKSLSNGTNTNYSIYTAPARGLVIITITATFASNSTGARYIAPLIGDGSDWTVINSCYTRVGASPSGTTMIGTTAIVQNIGEGRQIGVRLYQNSGGALNVSAIGYSGILIPYEAE